MRVYRVCRSLRWCLVRARDDTTNLPSQNRCFVGFLLFLLALTGTWNFALWMNANPYLDEYLGDGFSNETSTNDLLLANLSVGATYTNLRSAIFSSNQSLSTVRESFVMPTVEESRGASSEASVGNQNLNKDSVRNWELATNSPSALGTGETGMTISNAASSTHHINSTSYKSEIRTTALPSTLLDIKNFVLLHSNITVCDGASFIILVHSAVQNRDRRETIRETWGRNQPVLFLLGLSANATEDTAVSEEMRSYGDLIQGSFIDSYKNLTYKHILGLKWYQTFCPSVDYIVKVDDDVFVNVHLLSKFLQNLQQVDDVSSAESKSQPNVILCDVEHDAYVKRSFRSKWRLSYLEYRPYKYPTYCNGWAVIYSGSAVSRILSQTEKVPFVWIDDVYVTGLLAEKARLKPTQIEEKHLGEMKQLKENRKYGELEDFAKNVMLGPPQLSLEEMKDLWDFVSKFKKKKSDSRTVISHYY